MNKFNIGDRVRIIGSAFTGHVGTVVSHLEGDTYPSVRLDSGPYLYFLEDELEPLSDGEQDERRTTHHHACDCREAVHKEVAEALRSAIDHMDWVMWNRLDYTQEEIAANLEPFLDALERYDEMYLGAQPLTNTTETMTNEKQKTDTGESAGVSGYMANLKVIKQYDWGDYEELLEETDLHCPNCGEQEVYVERSEGDYYVGPSYYCTSCRFQFTMPSSGKMSDKYRIEDI